MAFGFTKELLVECALKTNCFPVEKENCLISKKI